MDERVREPPGGIVRRDDQAGLDETVDGRRPEGVAEARSASQSVVKPDPDHRRDAEGLAGIVRQRVDPGAEHGSQRERQTCLGRPSVRDHAAIAPRQGPVVEQRGPSRSTNSGLPGRSVRGCAGVVGVDGGPGHLGRELGGLGQREPAEIDARHVIGAPPTPAPASGSHAGQHDGGGAARPRPGLSTSPTLEGSIQWTSSTTMTRADRRSRRIRSTYRPATSRERRRDRPPHRSACPAPPPPSRRRPRPARWPMAPPYRRTSGGPRGQA